MVNRKSRNAQFINHGSPRAKMHEQIIKSKVKNLHPKEKKERKTVKPGHPEKFLKKTLTNLNLIISKLVDQEDEFILYLTKCVDTIERFRIDKIEYKLISDTHQVILIHSAVGKIMVSKLHLRNALNILLMNRT